MREVHFRGAFALAAPGRGPTKVLFGNVLALLRAVNVRILLDGVVSELLHTVATAEETDILLRDAVLAETAGAGLAWEEDATGAAPRFAATRAMVVGAAGKKLGIVADARTVEMKRDGTSGTTEHVGTAPTASLAEILMSKVLDFLLAAACGRDLLALKFLVKHRTLAILQLWN